MLQTPCNLMTVWKRHRFGLNLYVLKWYETVTSEDMRGRVCGSLWTGYTFSLTNWLLFPLWICGNRTPLKHLLSFYLILPKPSIFQSKLNKLGKKILCIYVVLSALMKRWELSPVGDKQERQPGPFLLGWVQISWLFTVYSLAINTICSMKSSERPMIPLLRYRQKYQPLSRKQQKVKLLDMHSLEVYNMNCFLISLIGPSEAFQLLPFSCHWIWPFGQPIQLEIDYLYVTYQEARQN